MNKKEDNYFCPLPIKWNEVFESLLKVWRKTDLPESDKPPVPLILAAWHETTGLQKLLRWKKTIEWARGHECSHLIPELSNDEKFRG